MLYLSIGLLRFVVRPSGKHFILDLVTYTGLSTECGDQTVLCGSLLRVLVSLGHLFVI